MEKLTLREIARFCSARVPNPDPGAVITGVSTDSRSICEGMLFVPLIGEKFDGHDFIEQARAGGAAAVLSSRAGNEPGTLYVKDTLQALHDIALGYRKRFRLKVTAVTGSVGKTTTKEMIASVLSEFAPTLKTEGNLNNLVGLPLSVLRIGKEHKAAVFEMGMNHFGEISRMTRVCLPDIAVISNIGVAHIEHLGSREGILRAKLEILEGLSRDGTVILNGDEPLLWQLRGRLPYKTIFFGIENSHCEVTAKRIRPNGADGMLFDIHMPIGTVEASLPASGHHNVMNALAAASVGMEFSKGNRSRQGQIDRCRLIVQGLSKFKNVAMRQNILREKGFIIIDDCYNANPDSMSAALSVLSSVETDGRRIAVLGDMLELGQYSKEAHEKLGEEAAKAADHILLFGAESENTLLGAIRSGKATSEIHHFETREELAAGLSELAKPGDVILFKGSRAMKLEQVRDLFLEGKK